MDDLNLLRQTTETFEEVARFYVGNSLAAVRARRKVAKNGPDPFHAAVLSRLALLSTLLRNGAGVNNQETVVELLDVFEGLVGGGDIPSKRRYPGLHLLEERRKADHAETRRPKPLGYRIHLYCPSRENRELLKTTIEACCEAIEHSDQTATKQDTSSILSEIEAINEWHLAPAFTAQSERLSTVIQKYWRCDCSLFHGDPKVAFEGRHLSGLYNEGISGRYLLCFSRRARSTDSWRSSNLLLFDKDHVLLHEQANASKVAKVIRVARKVRVVEFGSDHRAKRWRQVKSICEAFGQGDDSVTIRAGEGMIETSAVGNSALSVPPAMSSLRDSLRAQSPTQMSGAGRKDRVVLAVVLCYYYLHLTGTSWRPTDNVQPDFWFQHTDQASLQVRRPFLDLHAPTSANPNSIEGLMNKGRPSLPAFGKLLLEIWKGSEVTWNNLEETLAACSKDDTGEYWRCAIDACLGKDEMLKAAGNLRDVPRIRSNFVLKVVKSLQWLLEKVCRLSIDDAFAYLAQDPPVPSRGLPISLTEARSGDRQNRTSCLGQRANLLCLHDGCESWETISQYHASAAAEWMRSIKQKVHSFVAHKTTHSLGRPVKVAMLDTGIAWDKRTSFMYKDRIGEVRTWVDVKDVRNGEADQTWSIDTDGHGTHAASIMLNVDPEYQLYVAKVFEGRDEKQGNLMEKQIQSRVANAIRYASDVWEVDVISMSFGFNEHVDSIDKAIYDANANNTVIFAASSNCGGNGVPSWPARHPTVIGIFATDGHGNKYLRNPGAQDGEDNFATLGVEVNAWWLAGKKANRSGTSTATPIAAGTASMLIRFLREAKAEYLAGHKISADRYDGLARRLASYAAMRRVFRHFSKKRDGYDYIDPCAVLSQEAGDIVAITGTLLATIRKS